MPDIQKWPDNSQYSPLDPEIGAWYPDMVQGARDIDAMHVGRKMWMNGFCSSMKKGQNTRAKHPDTCA